MFMPLLPARPPVAQPAPGRARPLLATAALSALLVLLGACGASPAPSPAGDEASAGAATYAFGEPGQSADSSQVIEITATDAQAFEPAAVTVPLGATVTLRVTNTGTLPHEFVLGDEPFQATHEAEMVDMAHGHGTMQDEPYGFRIEPGQTKDLVWKFSLPGPGEVIYACHTPGHYAVGMKGTISVQE